MDSGKTLHWEMSWTFISLHNRGNLATKASLRGGKKRQGEGAKTLTWWVGGKKKKRESLL